MPVFSVLDKVSSVTAADPVLRRLSDAITRVPETARDVLHGVWLGHPLHPVLAQIPVGAWLSAAALDGVAVAAPSAAARQAAERSAPALILLGLVGVPAAAASGSVDWARSSHEQQRVGAVHAVTNSVATVLLIASLIERRRGRHGRGRLLGLLGVGAASAAAGIGGHLAYRFAAGVNHAEHVTELTDHEWSRLRHLDDLPDGAPQRSRVGETPVVVVRLDGRVRVLADACSHLAGPLSEGTVEYGCIVCPWHGSAFRLEDGSVRHGPATAPQPSFDVRVVDGHVEARLRRIGQERADVESAIVTGS